MNNEEALELPSKNFTERHLYKHVENKNPLDSRKLHSFFFPFLCAKQYTTFGALEVRTLTKS